MYVLVDYRVPGYSTVVQYSIVQYSSVRCYMYNMLQYRGIPRCTSVRNTGFYFESVVRTPTMMLSAVHCITVFFFLFLCCCRGGEILTKNRAPKTRSYMYIPCRVAPRTRFVRLRKTETPVFFLTSMID